jgi:hypothetical protein
MSTVVADAIAPLLQIVRQGNPLEVTVIYFEGC